MLRFKTLAFLVVVVFISFSNSHLVQKQVEFVYSTQYDYKYDTNESSSVFNNLKIAKNAKLVFVAAGDSGIKVLNPEQNYSIIYSFRSTEYIHGFTVTKDANYVFLPYENKLTIFDFTNRKYFVQIGQDGESIDTIDYIINESEDLIFIVQSTGQIRALNIQDKTKPTLAGQTIWFQQQIISGVLSLDENWLLICQDQKGVGIFKITKNIDGTVEFILAGAFKQNKSQGVEISKSQKYIVSINNRQGISIGDFSVISQANVSQYPMLLLYKVKQWWPTKVQIPSPFSLCISDDDNYLFLGVLAQGVFIIDITNKVNPVLFQAIIIPFHGMSIKLSADEKDLFYVNAQSIFIFPRIKPNLNQQYLNLFNGHLSSGFYQSPTYYRWRCYIDDSRNLYFGAFDDDGLWVIDITDPQNMNALQTSFKPINTQQIKSKGDIDALIFLKGYKYMVVPVMDGSNILAVYDISNILLPPHTPTLVQFIPFQTINYIVDFDLNKNEDILAVALGDSIVLIDVKNIGQFTVITQWKFQEGMKGDCTGIMLTINDTYLIGTSRGYGYFVLDIRNFKDIKMINYYDSLGAESIIASNISEDYCFLIDGLKGVLIIDLNKLPEISIVSNIQVPGWSNHITLVNNEQLMLVSSLEKSMVNMIDISNIYQPFIVSEYHYETQNGMSTCALKNNEYLFMNNNIGVRALPTKGDVQVHIEIQEILGFSEDINQFLYRKINKEDFLLVGQNIQLDIVFLYQPLDLIVRKLWYYSTQSLLELPKWIQYDPDEGQLKIQLVKESIDPTNQIDQTLNIIVIETVIPFAKEDFLFLSGDCKTDYQQANAIYSQLLNQGILNDYKALNPKFDLQNFKMINLFNDPNIFPDTILNTCLSKIIKSNLQRSVQLTPIYLKTKSSLILELNPMSNDNYISTINKHLTVSIIIPEFSGQFIYDDDSSINISINQEKNNLRVSGSVQNVNVFLKKKIIIFPSNGIKYSDLTAQLIISDSVNYNIDKQLKVTQISFLVEKNIISIHSQLSLQKQFEKEYENSEIEILSDFLFQFDQHTFISPDVESINYSAFIEDGKQYRPIEHGDWIQFSPQMLTFKGNPPQTTFRDTVRIKVIGDDGYTQVSDIFEINIYILPLGFVLKWIAQVLGPLIAVIVFYRYRYFFYNSIFDFRNSYSKVTAEVNKKFMIKIPLIQGEVKLSKLMIESLITRVQHSSGFQANNINIQRLYNYNCSKIEYPQIDDFEKEQDEKAYFQGNKKEDIEENAALKIIGQDNYNARSLTQAYTNFTSASNRSYLRNTDKNDINLNFNEKIRRAKEYIPTNEIEKRYLTMEGKVDMESVIKDMLKFNIEFKVNNKYEMASQYKEELENKKSTLHKCIKFILARYLLSLDHKTYLVIEYIKYYGNKNSFLFTQNDWYKQFINIISDDKLDVFGQTIALPKVQLILQNIKIPLMQIQLLSSRMEDFMNLREQGINPYLIKYILQADALGINFTHPSSFFPCLGESIHLKSHQLRSVESFKFSPGGVCYPIKRALNIDYNPYGPKNNMQFPNWLQLIIQPGVIILQGTPQIRDIEEILIRFYGTQGYIYKSFILRVEDNSHLSNQCSPVQSEQQDSDKKQIENQGVQSDEIAPIINQQGENQKQLQKVKEVLLFEQKNQDFEKQQEVQYQQEKQEQQETEMAFIKSQESQN